MKTRRRTRSMTLAAAPGLTALMLATTAAQADGSRMLPRAVPQAYTQECGSCHVAFPPGLLPAASWQRIMAGLGRHYGADASLDAASGRAIGNWLQTWSGTGKRGRETPPEDRITRSAWFEREHRKVDAAVWRHASVKSAANCGACHAGAERGHYDEEQIRLPAGLDTRPQRGWHD